MTWRLDWDSLNRPNWRNAIDFGAWRDSIQQFALRFRDSYWQPATAIAVACFLGTSTALLLLNAEGSEPDKVVAVEIAPAMQPVQKIEQKMAPEIAPAIQPTDDRRTAEIDALKLQLAAADADLATAAAKLAEASRRLAELQSFEMPRKLSYEQRRALIAALVPFRGQKLTITSVLGDSETRDYRDDFVQVFEASGWDLGGEKGVRDRPTTSIRSASKVAVHQINEHEGLSNDAINVLIRRCVSSTCSRPAVE